MAPGICTGPGTRGECDEQAAEPEHVEPHVGCAEGRSSCVEQFAGLCEGNACWLYSPARQGGCGAARDSRPHLRFAERGVLRVSERQPLFRKRGHELSFRCGAEALA